MHKGNHKQIANRLQSISISVLVALSTLNIDYSGQFSVELSVVVCRDPGRRTPSLSWLAASLWSPVWRTVRESGTGWD